MLRQMFSDVPRTALTGFYWAFLLYLLVPLTLMMAMSFKSGGYISFPIGETTLDWYRQVLQDRDFIDACLYSLYIAVVSTAIATIVGLWTAMLIVDDGFRGQAIVFALACLPAVTPGMIEAIALRVFITRIDLQIGTNAIILGHTIHAVPFVMIMILTRVRAMPPSLVEAAKDLGADSLVAFFRVTLPYLAPAIFGGMIFSMLSSIDDFVRTFFLGGYRPTLPMLMFARLQGGMSPEINAMATLVLLATTVVGLYAEYFIRRSRTA